MCLTKMRTATTQDTKERLLDAAERLFSLHGINATSLRAISCEAQVNVAATSYHFGSRDDLIQAVIRRRLSQLSEVRRQGLERLQSKWNGEVIPVRELLTAFMEPALAFGQDPSQGGFDFARFVARMHCEAEDLVQKELFTQLQGVVDLYLEELRRTLGHLQPQELTMRLAFAAGAMIQAILLPLKPSFAEYLSFNKFSTSQLLEMLVQFCTAGMSCEGAPNE